MGQEGFLEAGIRTIRPQEETKPRLMPCSGGAAHKWLCAQCDYEVEAEWKYCKRCGNDLTEKEEEEDGEAPPTPIAHDGTRRPGGPPMSHRRFCDCGKDNWAGETACIECGEEFKRDEEEQVEEEEPTQVG